MVWLEQRGRDKREYKNALAFVIPDKVEMDKARKGARTALAIASLLEQKAKYKFTTEDIEEFNSKAKDANSTVKAALRRLYAYILLPLPCKDGNSPIRLEMIDLQSQINTSQNLQERILDALKNHVFDSIRPGKLSQHSGLDNSETGYIKAEELVSYFFRFPNLPKILNDLVIQKAIQTSSINRSISVDVVKGKKPARSYTFKLISLAAIAKFTKTISHLRKTS